MEVKSVDHHEGVARKIVQNSISAAIERHTISEEVPENGGSSFERKRTSDNEEIAEEIIESCTRSISEHDDIAPDSLDDHDSVSDSSENLSASPKSSSSTTTSSHSSNSSLKKTKPCRLAQTFRKGDLMSEINNRDESVIPLVKKGTFKSGKRAPKISTWIDPTSVKGTLGDSKKMEEWITLKDKEKEERVREARRTERERKQRQREKEENKAVLQKKNFELWENKKKEILQQKIKRSEEMKARKKEKELDKIEKLKDNEKAFNNWRSHKESLMKETKRTERKKKKDEMEDMERIADEKKKEQKLGFEKWIERHKELEKQKKEAERAAREAEDELVMLEEYRKQDAEDEYVKWKLQKSQKKNTPDRFLQHPLAWSPAGRSDGKYRTAPNSRPSSPGEPLSKTLASLKNCPTYTRKLKTVDVCCRQISFWCHCQSENGFVAFQGNRSATFSPELASTAKDLPEMGDPMKLSRHTTPVNSRPASPFQSAAPQRRSSTK